MSPAWFLGTRRGWKNWSNEGSPLVWHRLKRKTVVLGPVMKVSPGKKNTWYKKPSRIIPECLSLSKMMKRHLFVIFNHSNSKISMLFSILWQRWCLFGSIFNSFFLLPSFYFPSYYGPQYSTVGDAQFKYGPEKGSNLLPYWILAPFLWIPNLRSSYELARFCPFMILNILAVSLWYFQWSSCRGDQ